MTAVGSSMRLTRLGVAVAFTLALVSLLLSPLAAAGATLLAIYTAQPPASAPAGGAIGVPVTVANAGTDTWNATGPNPVNLSYHWTDLGGKAIVWDGARTLLPAPVAPGASVTLNASVTTPATPGIFALKFDLVQEGVSWFSGQGVPAESISLTVQ